MNMNPLNRPLKPQELRTLRGAKTKATTTHTPSGKERSASRGVPAPVTIPGLDWPKHPA